MDTLRCFKNSPGTTEGRGKLVTKVETSVPQSCPVSSGQSNKGISLPCLSVFAEGARDRITSTGFSHMIGRSQDPFEVRSSEMQLRTVSHDAPFSFKLLRYTPRLGGEVGRVSGCNNCEENRPLLSKRCISGY